MLIVNALFLSLVAIMFCIMTVVCVVAIMQCTSRRAQQVQGYSVEERLMGISHYPCEVRAKLWEELRVELGFVSVASMLAAYDA